jgi:holin-like protein
MKILSQIGILFGLCWLSRCIENVLPISFPASVIGMILLLILLATHVLKVEHIREKSDFLLENLPFFFVPAAVGIMQYADTVMKNGAAFITICVVSLIVTFGATSWAVQLTIRLMEKRGKA